jgi:PAS domain S-box-containing protein
MAEHVANNSEKFLTPEEADQFFNFANELLAIIGFDGEFKRINTAWSDLLGYPSEEILDHIVQKFIHIESQRSANWAFKRLTEGQPMKDFETRLVCKDGTIRWVQWSASSSLPEKLVWLTAHDITNRKQAEKDWLDISAALQNAVEGIARVDMYGRFTSVNNTFAEMLGYHPEDLLGAHWHVSVHPDDVPKLQWAHETMLSEGKAEIEARGIKRDGSLSHSQIVLVKALDEDANSIGHHCFMKDISLRKQAETSLQRTEARLANLLRHVPGVLYQFTTHGAGAVSFSYISESCKNILGYEPADFFGDPDLVFKCVHPEDAQPFRMVMQKSGIELTPFRFELRCFTKTKELRWIQLSSMPERLSAEELLWNGLLTDITELKAAEAKIKELNEDLAQRLQNLATVNHELETLTHKLEIAYDEAMEASKLKSEFVANISHEVRTPISAVIGMSELLMDSPLNRDQEQLAKIISESAQALLTIINDILDFSKMEAGRIELESIDFSLTTTIKACIEWLRSSAEERGLTLTTTIDPAIPKVLKGDPLRIRQVLLNLTTNAIKFTFKGSVKVIAQLLNIEDDVATIKCEVIDTGIGLAENSRKRLFQPFSQADGSTTRKYGGTGLGLSISKRLIEMMGGEIDVHSAPGAGSSFWFTISLPVSKTQEGAPDIELDTGIADLGRLRHIQTHPATLLAKKAASEGEEKSAQGKWNKVDESVRPILLAEDNPVLQDLTCKQLQRLGFKVDVVNNGGEAVEAVKNNSYSVVFMDCQMPEMDGFRATTAIRSLEEGTGKRAVIIALTASAMPADRDHCMECGMDDYLSKPVRLHQIVEIVEKWMPEINPKTSDFQKGSLNAMKDHSSTNNSVPENSNGCIDLAGLKAMYGEESMHEILSMFTEEAQSLLTQMQDGLAARQTGPIKSAAHQLKGVAASVLATDLSQICSHLESEANNAAWTDAQKSLVDLTDELSRVTIFVTHFLQSQS